MRRLLLGVIALASLASVAPASAQQTGRWVRAESPGFVVFADTSEARVRDMIEELESFDSLLRRLTDAPADHAPRRLEIYAFRGAGPFRHALPGASETIVGFYSARLDIVAAYALMRDNYLLDGQDVLFHEYAHHFMYQYFANFYPAWYVEGFAEFVSTADFERDRVVIGRTTPARATWLYQASWLPMERLLTRDLDDGDDVAKFYAQSWLFTHYLFMTPGKMDQFRAYLRALQLGGDAIGSFSEAFGITPAQMQAELRGYLRSRPNALALNRPPPVEHSAVTVTQLPRSADSLMGPSTRVRRLDEDDEAAADALGDIRRLVGGQPADDFALMTLARAEGSLGDVGRARELLEPRLAANPNDVEALYVIGSALLRQSRDDGVDDDTRAALLAEARRYFVRAYRADPNHVPTLYRYVDSFNGEMITEADAENILNVLILARQLAPQVYEINMRTAELLLSHERYTEAVPILRVVAYDPHAGAGAEYARQLLAAAEAAMARHGAH